MARTLRSRPFMRATALMLAFSFPSTTTADWLLLGLTPAYAQSAATTITAIQAAAIQNGLANAIAGVNAQTFSTVALKTTALQNAIALTETNAITADGPAAAASITAALLASPALAQLAAPTIGRALGHAASTLAAKPGGIVPATAIATTIRNEGPAGSQVAFAAGVRETGGPESVAEAALGDPTVTSSISANNAIGFSGLTSSVSANTTSCGRPSCS